MTKQIRTIFSNVVFSGIFFFSSLFVTCCDSSSKIEGTLSLLEEENTSPAFRNMPYENRLLPMVFQAPKSTVLISPYSLWQMAVLLWLGSDGITHRELGVLALMPKNKLDISASDMSFQIAQLCKQYHPYLQTAMGLFVRKDVVFFPDFMAVVQQSYLNTALTTVPFDTDPKASVNIINRYIARETLGRLKHVLSAAPPAGKEA